MFEISSPFMVAVPITAPQLTATLADNPSDLLYATFLGGTGDECGYGIAVDGSGQAYVTGDTSSADFPAASGPGYDTSYNGGYDAFVVKLNSNGTALTYATFLGGSGYDDGRGIAVDGSGQAYATGVTASTDFPAANGPGYDTAHNGGGGDAYVVKLSASGTALTYATFLGGSGADQGFGIAVDSSGQAYVTGGTTSVDFPAASGPGYDTSLSGEADAFVVKLSASGTALTYATFLGGSGTDRGYSIAVDGSGQAYVTGDTASADFPAASGPGYDTTYNGYADAFAVKLNASGTALTYATFLGGSSSSEQGWSIAVDGTGQAYVTGWTASVDFPAASGPGYDTSYNGGYYDAYVVKLATAGPTYSISGRVTGQNGNGISEVTVSAGVGGSAATDGGGYYTIMIPRAGTYTLTPSKSGYTFSPSRISGLWVNGAVTGKDFLGVDQANPPARFLDLPFTYTTFGEAARGNTDGNGPRRVNSWFDHSYPNYGRDCTLTLYSVKVYSDCYKTDLRTCDRGSSAVAGELIGVV